jgi:hypothetical protein
MKENDEKKSHANNFKMNQKRGWKRGKGNEKGCRKRLDSVRLLDCFFYGEGRLLGCHCIKLHCLFCMSVCRKRREKGKEVEKKGWKEKAYHFTTFSLKLLETRARENQSESIVNGSVKKTIKPFFLRHLDVGNKKEYEPKRWLRRK